MKDGQMVPTDSDQADMQMALIAKALGHPARLRILRLLARTPGCIGGDIVDAVGLAQSTVSEHLRILKDAGLICGQIDPPRVCYSLAPGALVPLAGFLQELDTSAGPCDPCITPEKG
jgi:ArsR family transcriptional regulator